MNSANETIGECMLPDTEACFHLDLLPKSAVTFRKVPIEKLIRKINIAATFITGALDRLRDTCIVPSDRCEIP